MAQFLGPVSDIVDPEDVKLRKLSEQLLLFGWYTLLGTRRAGWVDNVGDSGLLGPGPHHLCLNSPPPTSLADSFSPLPRLLSLRAEKNNTPSDPAAGNLSSKFSQELFNKVLV